MRSGGEKRGNSYDRKRRKDWVLRAFGNGERVQCTHCCEWLDRCTVEIDRIVPGGSYRRDNIQPSCGECNRARADNPAWRPPNSAWRPPCTPHNPNGLPFPTAW